MYFKRFKPKNWRKRSGEACRRNCAVLPKNRKMQRQRKNLSLRFCYRPPAIPVPEVVPVYEPVPFVLPVRPVVVVVVERVVPVPG